MGINGVNNMGANAPYTGSKKRELRADEAFKKAVDEILEASKLTKDNIKKDDWREMSDEEWDKLMEHIDKYVDEHKRTLEEMKKIQEEAAIKKAAEAPANMRAIAAADAALKAAANGVVEGGCENVETLRERESWTYDMKTDDQVILATAKMANEYADDMMTKSQEFAITDTTSTGITNVSEIMECAKVYEDEEEKVWVITVFTKEGITCKKGKAGGALEELWSIKYENPGDYKRVWDFLERFDKDADLKFADDKKFWEDFLAGRISDSKLNEL